MSFRAEINAVPLRSYLFAPGNSEKLLTRVFEAGADAVVLDLEDAVPPESKDQARHLVAQRLADLVPAPGHGEPRGPGAAPGSAAPSPAVFVRVNGLETGRTEDDVRAAVSPTLMGIRLPKVESADQVRQVSAWLASAEAACGRASGTVLLDCTIESAQGVVYAREIAAADPRVRSLIFGHADYVLDVAADPGPEELETLYARSCLVTASRAAGIAAPVDGAYTRLRDPEGLRRSTDAARRLGYFGKSAIHPEQIATIHAVFAPPEAEVARAREIVSAYERAAAAGEGAVRLESGQFVDRPIVIRAYRTLALAQRGDEAEGGTPHA